MYFIDDNIRDLQTLLAGYNIAINLHNIEDDLMDFNLKFSDYILEKYSWCHNCGWADAIIENNKQNKSNFDIFLKIFDEYINAET